jgi:hypothetical protein
LAVVLISFSSFYSFYVIGILDRQKQHEQKLKELFILSPKGAEELEIFNSFGRFLLKRNQGSWILVSPVEAKADDLVIENILSYFEKVEARRIVSKEETSLPERSKYGLGEPVIAFSIKTKETTMPHRLKLGDLTPDGMGVYTSYEPRKEILILPMYLTILLNQNEYGLRNKTLLDFGSSQVSGIEIEFAQKRISMKRVFGENWTLLEPLAVPAESSAVDNLLEQMRQIRVGAFVDEKPKSLVPYGLDHPWARITVRLGDSASEQVLLFGTARGEEGLYAKRADLANVVLLPLSVSRFFASDIFPLRDKRVFKFRDEEIVSFMIDTKKGDHLELERNGPSEWRINNPQMLKADADAVADYFSDLRLTRSRGFLSDSRQIESLYGLAPPQVVIALRGKEGHPPLTLHIGNPWPKNPNWVLARRPGENEMILLDRNDADRIVKTVHDLQYRQILSFNLDDVRRIDLVYQNKAVRIDRGKTRVWRASIPKRMKLSEGLSVLLFLRDLWRFKFAKVFSPGEVERELRSAPDLRVDLWLKDDQNLASFSIWNYRGSRKAFLVRLKDHLYLVEGEAVRLFRSHLDQIYGQLGAI